MKHLIRALIAAYFLALAQGCSHPQVSSSQSSTPIGLARELADDSDSDGDEETPEPRITASEEAAEGHRAAWRAMLKLRGFYVNSSFADQPPARTMVRGARRTLDIEIYEMEDADFLQDLEDAVDRGVRVRVVKEPDSVGEKCKIFAPVSDFDDPICKTGKRIRDKVIASGGQYVPFAKAELCGRDDSTTRTARCFQHGKLILADANTLRPRALMSTGNFNSTSFCNAKRDPSKCNRDFTVVTRRRSVIRTLQKVFESDLGQKRYALKTILDEGSSQLTVSPYSLDPLVELIRSARHRIQVANQYLKEPQLNEALLEAARRGVKVEITLASLCAFGRPRDSARVSAEKLFAPFDAAGIHLRMFTKSIRINDRPGYLHAKAVVVDDQVAWVGSVNGSDGGLNQNREFGLIFRKAKWVDQVSRVLVKDHQDPMSETWRESLDCLKD